MNITSFEQSKEIGPHRRLSHLEGKWEGVSRVWFEKGKLADESPMRGTMRLILGGRFVLHEYQGSIQGEPVEGVAIYGYNVKKKQFENAWVDSYHTGEAIMSSISAATGNIFSALGSYAYTDENGEETHWGWRTTIELPENDKVIIRMDNIAPSGKPDGGVETTYVRQTEA